MANGKNGIAKEEKKKLAPNQVVQAAYAYLNSVIGQNQIISGVRIEQLEPLETNAFWKIVLSYDVAGQFSFDKKRELKEFKVDAHTGDVIWMKIFPATKP